MQLKRQKKTQEEGLREGKAEGQAAAGKNEVKATSPPPYFTVSNSLSPTPALSHYFSHLAPSNLACQLHSWELSRFIYRYMMAIHVCATHAHAHRDIFISLHNLKLHACAQFKRQLDERAPPGEQRRRRRRRGKEGNCLLSFWSILDKSRNVLLLLLPLLWPAYA